MFDLLKKLYTLKLAPVSPDSDKAVVILKEELPFQVHEFKSGEECNGWTIPQNWEVRKAEIRKDGELIYDGSRHPLGVMGYSKSFKGSVSLEELKNHITYRKDLPDAIGYHCDYYYKLWRADWGFSMPYTLYRSLADGEYQIDLEIQLGKGTMKVCDFLLSGRCKDTIIFNAHNCHAAQANDDIAGVVVGVELMKRLAKSKNRFSYRLIIAPEHLGTVFYLSNLAEDVLKTFKYAFFLEMLGTQNPLALQETFTGTTILDRACHHYLKYIMPKYKSDKFRRIVGNDETVWEAPGYEIPTVSLSRWPFFEYHTSMDNEDIIGEEQLEESVNTILGIVNILETNCSIRRKFKGLIALSNPKYDLYISPGTDPSIPMDNTEVRKTWNYLMDCLPRYFDEKTTILDIAIKHDVEYQKLYNYLLKFKEKGLVEFIDA